METIPLLQLFLMTLQLLTLHTRAHQRPPCVFPPQRASEIAHVKRTYRDTRGLGSACQISRHPFIMLKKGRTGASNCYYWHRWVWTSVAWVVDWFSIRIDWTKWALRLIRRDSRDKQWHDLLLRQPHDTFIHLFSVSRKRGNCSIYTRLLNKSVMCHHIKNDTHFPSLLCKPAACGQKWTGDNEWKKGKRNAI